MKNKILSTVYGLAVFFLIITFAIGLPIYFRGFYYLQIGTLGIEKSSGFNYQTIKTAYDQVLDFLTLPFTTFQTGGLAYTEAGKQHFIDCKWLFTLNSVVLIVSFATFITLIVLNKKRVITLCKPFKKDVSFISALAVLILFATLSIIVAVDFNGAFVVFHKIFFYGKDNWIFDPKKDEIIKILPAEFFLNCAVLIACAIAVTCLTVILIQIFKRTKKERK